MQWVRKFTCTALSGALMVIGLSMTMMVTACNTTAGLGQEVSSTGKAVTNSAEKVKQGL